MVIRESNINDIPDIAKVHVDTWRTTYKGIYPDGFLKSISYEKISEHIKQFYGTGDKSCIVAEDNAGNIIGFAACGYESSNNTDYKGELYAIYILEQYQKKGIGKLLIQAVAKKLISIGIKSMLVWVVSDNPSKYFYERLGGEKLRNNLMAIDGGNVEEICYGWSDINILL